MTGSIHCTHKMVVGLTMCYCVCKVATIDKHWSSPQLIGLGTQSVDTLSGRSISGLKLFTVWAGGLVEWAESLYPPECNHQIIELCCVLFLLFILCT